jgi:hypothetical protein
MPNGFRRTDGGECVHWTCHPDAEVAHQGLLARLRTIIGEFLRPGTALGSRRFGNLGQFVALFIGERCGGLPDHQPDPFTSALSPLSDISHDGIDIIWLLLRDDPRGDAAVLQEVKTTGAERLDIAYDLAGDYEKLFGTDPQLTWKQRVSHLKAYFLVARKEPRLAARLNKFLGVTPSNCNGVRVLPTLVYDSRRCHWSVAEQRLLAVRTSVIGLGWDSSQVLSWTVGIDNLESRFERLSQGC